MANRYRHKQEMCHDRHGIAIAKNATAGRR
jgi:hypothetical protein